MSNGDSLDGFVFPPFIPAAAARPASPPAPAAQPPAAAEEPPAAPQTAAPGRATMPWDVETPIVSEPAAQPQAAAGQAEDEDLPWLERPAPREAAAEAPPAEAPAAPAQDEAFPDWLAWDDRAADDARPELDAVAPVEGLQDFAPVEDIGFLAPTPAAEWQEAAPAAADHAADALEPSDWLLGAPEAAEPPTVVEPAAEVTFASPAAAAAAEPAFDVTVEDDALTFAAAAPGGFDNEAVAAADEEPAAIAESPFAAFDDEPAAAVAESPFVAFDDEPGAAVAEPELLDEEWQAADVEPAAAPADTHPFVADTEAVLSAEPDPFTAAALDEVEAVAPVEADAVAAPFAETAAGGVFTDVAARLEDIARTLRERPDDLLSGTASDPLALLVAGYVMGYGARR
jgi:hypothetical protein